ncbi:MAG: hypothetical protein WC371_04315 [Parachlamydiales bacterium]
MLAIFTCVALVLGLVLGWTFLTRGFKVSKVIYPYCSDVFYKNRFEKGEKATLEVLSQPFVFLGKGCQIYAFESLDGKYVLKLVKLHRYRIPFYKRFLSGFFQNRLLSAEIKQKKRLEATFAHYRLAMERLPKETALLYAHFDPSCRIGLPAFLTDRLGRNFEIDLNQTFFLIQKKAVNFKDKLLLLQQEGDFAKTSFFLDLVVGHLKQRMAYGVFDNDHPGYARNLGFVQNEAISIDVGNFRLKEKPSAEDLQKEYFSCLKQLLHWAKKRYPEAAQYLREKYRVED